MSVSFVEPASSGAIHDLKHLPGVIDCEPFRSLPVRMRNGHRSRQLAILGLHQQNDLYRLMDKHLKVVPLPSEGLVISAKLAELLEIRPEDPITLEVLEGKRPVLRISVAGLISDLSGTNAYMNIQALHRTMQEGNTVSGAFLTVDSKNIDALYTELKSTPRIASVTVQKGALESFRKTIAENLLVMTTFNVIFASIIAFGVVYNTARISLSESSRELATLRVIGFTRAEVSAILLGELALITLAAIPVGLVMGYGFAALMTLSLDTDLYRIPLVVNRSTFAFAAVVIMMASLFS
jgi:putative ABC transport system permease protein